MKLPRKTLFKQLSADYFEYYKNKAKERNWARIGSILKHLDGFFGRIEVPKISLWTVENYIRHRRKWNPKVRFSTLNLELDYLKAILHRGVDRKVLSSIPKISHLPVQESRARILSGEELEEVISKVTKPHRDAIMLALDTGIREGELLRLRPRNVDFKTGVIHIEGDTKNLKIRDVPMTTRVREILTRRFKKHGDHLFEFKTVSAMSQSFSKERKWIKISRWRFHDLRHSFCTNLLRKRVDPYTVMRLSGHSKLEMVTRYLHTDEDLKRAAIAALEEIPTVTNTGLK